MKLTPYFGTGDGRLFLDQLKHQFDSFFNFISLRFRSFFRPFFWSFFRKDRIFCHQRKDDDRFIRPILTKVFFDERLGQYLNSAQQMIEREGATALDLSTLEDQQLVVMYAAWLWRRRDTQEGMPRMLRWALNNRIFSEKAKEG